MKTSWFPRVAVVCLLALTLTSTARAVPGDRSDGEEEEIAARQEWFYGRRGLEGGAVSVEAARDARAAAALDVQARTLEQARSRAPMALWSSIGPAPMTMLNWAMDTVAGRVTTISIDATDPDIMYVGGAAGGFWKSTNGGTTWVNLFEALPTQTVGASAIAPTNHLDVWVGTGDYNSSCGGYFGMGVFRSTDGGATFALRNGSGAGSLYLGIVTGISVNPTNASDVVVVGEDECSGGTGQGGVYRTTDAGATWTKTRSGTVHEVVRDPSNPLTLYIGIATNAVMKSLNGGTSWGNANSGITTNGGRWELAISPSAPQTLYVLNSTTSDLYRTTDGGGSWTVRNASSCDGQCGYNMTMKVALNNPDVLYRGTILPYKSTNGGTSFAQLTSGWGGSQEVHQDIQHIERHPTDPNTIYIGSDGGIWKTMDTGSTFTPLNGNLNMTQFYDVAVHPTLDTIALGGSQDNSSEAFSGSAVWSVEVVTGDGFVNLINPVDPNLCYVSSYYGNILRSMTGPTGNYQNIGQDITGNCDWLTPYMFDPANPDILYTACDRIWRSTDQGSNWTAVSPALDGSNPMTALAIAPSASQIVYTANSGDVWRTTDGGANWVDVTGNLPSRFVTDLAVDPADPMHVYATLSGFGEPQLQYSTTGGLTWTAATSGVPDIPVNTVMLLSNPTRVYIGTDVGILVSSSGDAGPYVPDMAGFPAGVPVMDLEHNPNTDTITAGTYGRGALQRDAAAVETDAVLVAKGAGPSSGNDSRLNAYRGDGTQIAQLDVLGFTTAGFGANVGGGDLDGDLYGDVVTGQGPGPTHAPVVKAFDRDGTALPGGTVTAYGGSGYGANVSTSDVENDSYAELLTGPGEGEVYGPQVRAFNHDGTGSFTAIAKINYFAYGTLKYGVNVAGAPYDLDAFGEIVSGAGPGEVFGPHVRGWQFDGVALSADGKVNFFAYSTLRYGVNAGAADVDLDGSAELLTGAGPGMVFGPAVRGFNTDGGAVTAIAKINFFAFATGRYGANVAGGDVDGDGYGELATGPGPDSTRSAELAGFDYDGTGIASIPPLQKVVFPGVSYGLTVGTSRLGY